MQNNKTSSQTLQIRGVVCFSALQRALILDANLPRSQMLGYSRCNLNKDRPPLVPDEHYPWLFLRGAAVTER